MLLLEQLQEGVVLPIDKPCRWSSFQAVNKVKAYIRNQYGIKKFKIGHAGTLDPLASGLLLICIGKATKRIPQLQDGAKVYTGTMVLGATTPCFDLERPIDCYYPFGHITLQQVRDTARTFEGTIMQVPPMFSAVKVEGRRAYTYARTDDPTVTIQPKPVEIYEFAVADFRPGRVEAEGQLTLPEAVSADARHLYREEVQHVPDALPQVDFRVHCGKGTYIRSLARDFGSALGSGAFLAALRREQVGDYNVASAIRLDNLDAYFLQ